MSNHLTENNVNEYNFSILRPAGNDTALVHSAITDLEQKKTIADAILKKFPNVEQVGFINIDPDQAELIMTGGEFCGNATRSAAFKILDGEKGDIEIKSSGVQKKLVAGIDETGESFSQMPVYSDPSYIRQDPANEQNYLVTLEGIVHYVSFDTDSIKGLSEEEIKTRAREKMAELGIDQNIACGVIYTEKKEDSLVIYPVVYVQKADTLYFETACGSGTTAVGLVEALKNKSSVRNLEVKQPSGLSIKVSVDFDGTSFGFAKIQSPIENIHEGIISAGKDITFHSPKNISKSQTQIYAH